MTILERVLNTLGINSRDDFQMGFKAVGDGYWTGVFTNKFEDKQTDILTSKAHPRYVQRVQAGLVPMPPVVIWHAHEFDDQGNVKATTKFAETLWIDYADGFTFAIGKFDDTVIGKAVEDYYRSTKAVDTMSHRFVAPRWARSIETVKASNGTRRTVQLIDDYNVIELTVVPPGAEINPYTGFVLNSGQQEEKSIMPLMEKQKTAIRERLASAGNLADEIIAQFDKLAQQEKALEEAGVVYKAFSDFSDVTPEPETEQASQKATNEQPSIDGTLLVTLLESQNDIVERQIALEKGLTDIVDQLKASKQEAETLVKALRLRVEEKPQRVDDSTVNVVPDEKAKQAEEVIEQQKTGAVYDPFWGAMNVPRN